MRDERTWRYPQYLTNEDRRPKYAVGTPVLYLFAPESGEVWPNRPRVLTAGRVVGVPSFRFEDGAMSDRYMADFPETIWPLPTKSFLVYEEHLVSLEEMNAAFAWLRQEPPAERRCLESHIHAFGAPVVVMPSRDVEPTWEVFLGGRVREMKVIRGRSLYQIEFGPAANERILSYVPQEIIVGLDEINDVFDGLRAEPNPWGNSPDERTTR